MQHRKLGKAQLPTADRPAAHTSKPTHANVSNVLFKSAFFHNHADCKVRKIENLKCDCQLEDDVVSDLTSLVYHLSRFKQNWQRTFVCFSCMRALLVTLQHLGMIKWIYSYSFLFKKVSVSACCCAMNGVDSLSARGSDKLRALSWTQPDALSYVPVGSGCSVFRYIVCPESVMEWHVLVA